VFETVGQMKIEVNWKGKFDRVNTLRSRSWTSWSLTLGSWNFFSLFSYGPVALFTKICKYNLNFFTYDYFYDNSYKSFFTKINLRQILILRLKLHLR